MNIMSKAIFQKWKAYCLDKELYLKLYIEMIWNYNLRIHFEEVCKFPSNVTLAHEKDSVDSSQQSNVSRLGETNLHWCVIAVVFNDSVFWIQRNCIY